MKNIPTVLASILSQILLSPLQPNDIGDLNSGNMLNNTTMGRLMNLKAKAKNEHCRIINTVISYFEKPREIRAQIIRNEQFGFFCFAFDLNPAQEIIHVPWELELDCRGELITSYQSLTISIGEIKATRHGREKALAQLNRTISILDKASKIINDPTWKVSFLGYFFYTTNDSEVERWSQSTTPSGQISDYPIH
ncbi:hypothetical protein SAMD00019534_114330 [Acytostelium subglobosum LB1]|uniref:hypothetical protein n=1 Tax=Acytostelium subglobosum LB1 TaxID=1410327 RepID=UPI000645071E|nr:hypothetical protein SAMD00019534_114330 [Acytostelium subglobosum LB1]GAM28257.1 hypothetical protein SAMD00019534_114330 [Acytostelium subglobosum LB1]|eukprot:XP_012748891.1 hypothetical protein SAMD00019534_114330 [Acytostelium subglobosum LB1]